MLDKRGTGMSDRVTELPGLDERMDDVRAVLDAAGMDQAALLGISEGGPYGAVRGNLPGPVSRPGALWHLRALCVLAADSRGAHGLPGLYR